MALFLAFKRSGTSEKVAQALLFPSVLVLGLLVLWPLLMMLALSFGDPYDWWQGQRWPDFTRFTSLKRLHTMYLVRRYDYWPSLKGFNIFYRTDVTDADTIIKFDGNVKLEGNWRARGRDGIACLKSAMPWTHYETLYDSWEYFKVEIPYSGYTGLAAEAWKRFLRRRYRDVRTMNVKFQTDYPSFGHVRLPDSVVIDQRSPYPPENPWLIEFKDFLERDLRPEWRLVRLEARWYRGFLSALPEVKGGVDRLNGLFGTSYRTWDELRMSATVPGAKDERKYWEIFVREKLTPFYLEIAVDGKTERLFAEFLAARWGSPAAVAAAYGVPAAARVPLPPTVFEAMGSATAYRDWDAFVRTLPAEAIRVRGPELIWRRWVAEKYREIEALNREFGTRYAGFEDVPWPQVEIDELDWETHRLSYIVEEVFKNYRRAWEFITGISPALVNTARFAVLFTLLSVLTNVGAGYVLSRYARGALQLFIVYFLALAAFPIEAIAVPNFIMLRKLGMLNTVWALVLPMAVNGYYIYLMKTAFDSIPADYFEEAVTWGAGHWTLFRQVALPFAMPMVSVIAVYSFLWSYSNFMWALIVSQKNTQLTLPVFVFDLSQVDVAPCLLGALMVITTIPPLALFIFANRALQRSLVLPRV